MSGPLSNSKRNIIKYEDINKLRQVNKVRKIEIPKKN